ncbi:5766_t:CDS:10 [Ambispora leptoticha]|uniref:5766_t:CDS:1 n=1 Tax=Ambispora leptoticha TaxID=144679 RepID=A0A9N8V0Q2_9GLOM|nr:5766_t:CDS:10 [Ambispora leptoticha]
MTSKAETDVYRPETFSNYFWGRDEVGYEVLMTRMRQAKQTCEEVRNMLQERAAIEEDYGKRLLKLAKSQFGKDEIGTLRESFDVTRKAIEATGSSHIKLAQQIRTDLVQKIIAFTALQKDRRKQQTTILDRSLRTKQTHASHLQKASLMQDIIILSLSVNSMMASKRTLIGRDLEKLNMKLEKSQIAVKNSDQEYQSLIKGMAETIQRWNYDWRVACDKFQYMEEERIHFLKTHLWEFANLISQSCVADDESSESIRVSLEACDIEKDISSFIRERATGPEIPEPPSYINFQSGDKDPGPRYTLASFEKEKVSEFSDNPSNLDPIEEASDRSTVIDSSAPPPPYEISSWQKNAQMSSGYVGPTRQSIYNTSSGNNSSSSLKSSPASRRESIYSPMNNNATPTTSTVNVNSNNDDECEDDGNNEINTSKSSPLENESDDQEQPLNPLSKQYISIGGNVLEVNSNNEATNTAYNNDEQHPIKQALANFENKKPSSNTKEPQDTNVSNQSRVNHNSSDSQSSAKYTLENKPQPPMPPSIQNRNESPNYGFPQQTSPQQQFQQPYHKQEQHPQTQPQYQPPPYHHQQQQQQHYHNQHSHPPPQQYQRPPPQSNQPQQFGTIAGQIYDPSQLINGPGNFRRQPSAEYGPQSSQQQEIQSMISSRSRSPQPSTDIQEGPGDLRRPSSDNTTNNNNRNNNRTRSPSPLPNSRQQTQSSRQNDQFKQNGSPSFSSTSINQRQSPVHRSPSASPRIQTASPHQTVTRTNSTFTSSSSSTHASSNNKLGIAIDEHGRVIKDTLAEKFIENNGKLPPESERFKVNPNIRDQQGSGPGPYPPQSGYPPATRPIQPPPQQQINNQHIHHTQPTSIDPARPYQKTSPQIRPANIYSVEAQRPGPPIHHAGYVTQPPVQPHPASKTTIQRSNTVGSVSSSVYNIERPEQHLRQGSYQPTNYRDPTFYPPPRGSDGFPPRPQQPAAPLVRTATMPSNHYAGSNTSARRQSFVNNDTVPFNGVTPQNLQRPVLQQQPVAVIQPAREVPPARPAIMRTTNERTDDGRPILGYVTTLYDYQATIPEEISFTAGDILVVLAIQDDGWWEGELLDESRKVRGLFPSNFTTPLV